MDVGLGASPYVSWHMCSPIPRPGQIRPAVQCAKPLDPGLGWRPSSLTGSWQLCQQLFCHLSSSSVWDLLLTAHPLFSAKCSHIRSWHWNKVFNKHYLKGFIVSHAGQAWSPISSAYWLAQGKTGLCGVWELFPWGPYTHAFLFLQLCRVFWFHVSNDMLVTEYLSSQK